MKKMWIVAALLLAVTGCASPTSEQPAETPQAEGITPQAEQSAEPESGLPLQSAEPESFPDKESEYLHAIKKRTDVPTIAESTDDQLLEAGLLACEILAENPSISEIRLVADEQPGESGNYFASQVVATHAQMFICPELELAP